MRRRPPLPRVGRGGGCRVDLVVECTTLFPDVLPAIGRWRTEGITVALVSNCVANTRPLLDALGLTAAVDHVALSCEVGSSKPDPVIYLDSAARLGVAPAQVLFVDDRVRFCAGAEAVGMRSVRIDRSAAPGTDPASLAEVPLG